MNVQFVEYMLEVVADRRCADAHDGSDLAGDFSFCQQIQDLHLPPCQRVNLLVDTGDGPDVAVAGLERN